MNNSSMVGKDRLDFDPVIPEDERRFYQKAYPNINYVCERKVHCTVCKMHIGTAPSNESIIRMHPILRVTHCKKCHEFYNSGEFSKGEDGSELYCRWCGQGGEVYCCSNCPFVFCKSCIISNLSRGVVADIEQNENWSCFNCAPKMLWPLRAQHWALIKFIDKQKKAILNSNLSDAEIKAQMIKDRSLCCKTKKTSGYGSDSSGTSDISLSRLKQKAGEKRNRKSLSKEDLSTIGSPAMPKKPKANDEVVCTPDVMSMLENECQLAAPPAPKPTAQPTASSPKIMSIPRPSPPPPIMVRNAQVTQMRPQAPTAVVKKTVIGPRMPGTAGNGDFSTPVYHTINGYRIDLNSAAQQETVRLPNGKLIQVKRQGTGPQTVTTVQSAPNQQVTQARVIHNTIPPTTIQTIGNVPTQQIVHSSGGHIIRAQLQTPRSITVQNPSIIPQFQQQATPQYQQITIRQPNQQIATIRYQGTPSQQVTNILQNGTVQLLNGTAVTTTGGQVATVRQVPTFVKQFFPNTPLGVSRTQLQNQIFSAMEICQHLMGKVQTLTNSNAYKTAKSLTDVKELYIHLSYLLTYAIGRFKGLQDNCLSDMRDLGFTNDANSLENGQLAAVIEMVRKGQITDFADVNLDSIHALIARNMDIMTTAAADSSTADDNSKLKQIKYHESDVEESKDNENETNETMNENFKDETAEYDDYVDFPAPEVQLTEEDDDDCLLVETIKKPDSDNENEENAANDESDDDSCLLVEIGERKSDDEWNQPINDLYESDEDDDDDDDDYSYGNRSRYRVEDEEEDEQIAQRFSTSYENDDDYRAPPLSAFTPDLDIKLIELIREKPALWDPIYKTNNSTVQKGLWRKIARHMPKKQASDAEEDEITIVEPKTDTINLDSDNEEEHISPIKSKPISQPTPIVRNHTNNTPTTTYPNADSPNIINTNTMNISHQMPLVNPTTTTNAQDELTAEYDFSKLNFLANMLDVDLTEGNGVAQVPKKPRKKTTNKPNPTLLKQKEIQERERLENIKKNDAKLKMQVQIPLNKVEDIYEYAKPLLDELKYDNDELQGKDEEIRVVDSLEGETKIHQEEVKVTEGKAEDEDDKKLVEEVEKLNDTEEETCGKINKKDEKEISMESDEVILVEVDHLNQLNESEEQKNDSEENEISVAEIIEQEEFQDSYEDPEPMESSSISNDMASEREEAKEDSYELPNEDEAEKQSEDTEIEETEFLNHDNDENKDLDEETEVIMDFESNTCEAIKTAKNQDSDEEGSLEMDINADPLLNEIEKNLPVPAENRNILKNVDNSLDAAMLRTMLISKE